MKVALLVAYDGTDFHGFARQRTARSVQGALEEKLTLLLRAPVEVVCAGRTDAGVHAAGQVVSFDAPAGTSPDWLRDRMNRWLAPEVSVRAAAVVPDDFSARFSAVRREYEYRCYVSTTPDPFLDRFALFVRDAPRLTAMRAGARALIGEHDFSAFCRRGDGSMTRRLRSIKIVRAEDWLTFEVKADAFCHQMVRSIVGTLLDVGSGRMSPDDVAAALGARDRARAGSVAPARALHLVRVVYESDPFELGARRGKVSPAERVRVPRR